MTIDTEQDVRDALAEIATWYAEPSSGSGSESPDVVDDHRQPSRTRSGQRVLLVAAAVVAVIGGAIVLASRTPSANTAAVNRGPVDLDLELDRATVLDECLDVDTAFDLDRLRDSGTIHRFGRPDDRVASAVISASPVHVVCSLAQRDNGDWFGVLSLADTHGPLASSDAVSVLVAAGLADGLLVAGRVGADVATIEIDQGGDLFAGQIDGGWWVASLGPADDLGDVLPPFTVAWTTTATGERLEAPAIELLPASPWKLCAADSSCRAAQVIELQALAAGDDTGQQQAILADGTVTSEEYRAALRRWGDCIADATGEEVTFGDDGLFTIHGSGEHVTDAFEQCKTRHVGLVTEAIGLVGIEDP